MAWKEWLNGESLIGTLIDLADRNRAEISRVWTWMTSIRIWINVSTSCSKIENFPLVRELPFKIPFEPRAHTNA